MFEKQLHVAIIPDGNRRWANSKNYSPWKGHEEGVKRIEEIIDVLKDTNVKYLSIWGSSRKNLEKRPLREKKELIDIYDRYFEKLFSDENVYKNEVCINVFGDWKTKLPNKLVNRIISGVKSTSEHKKKYLNFFLAYDGTKEMLDAVKQIVSSDLDAEDITEDVIKSSLLTKNLPPVDLLIRTGGEPHLSTGFMMWDIADSQLFFTDKLFPDFGVGDFLQAIDDFYSRERRYGA